MTNLWGANLWVTTVQLVIDLISVPPRQQQYVTILILLELNVFQVYDCLVKVASVSLYYNLFYGM